MFQNGFFGWVVGCCVFSFQRLNSSFSNCDLRFTRFWYRGRAGPLCEVRATSPHFASGRFQKRTLVYRKSHIVNIFIHG